MLSRRVIVILLAITVLAFTACRTQSADANLAAKVKAFDNYPIVWLGETYDADGVPDPITTARMNTSAAFYHPLTKQLIKPEFRWFSIVYGDCKIPAGATACPVPLQLDFSAPCETYSLSNIAKKGTVNVRGMDAIVQSNGNLRFETADFTLTISPIGSTEDEQTQKALRIANDLVPANAKAKSSLTGASFRAKPANLCANIGGTATASASPTSTPTPTAATATPTPTP